MDVRSPKPAVWRAKGPKGWPKGWPKPPLFDPRVLLAFGGGKNHALDTAALDTAAAVEEHRTDPSRSTHHLGTALDTASHPDPPPPHRQLELELAAAAAREAGLDRELGAAQVSLTKEPLKGERSLCTRERRRRLCRVARGTAVALCWGGTAAVTKDPKGLEA